MLCPNYKPRKWDSPPTPVREVGRLRAADWPVQRGALAWARKQYKQGARVGYIVPNSHSGPQYDDPHARVLGRRAARRVALGVHAVKVRWLLYLEEPRAVLVEQRWRVLAPGRSGWHTDRYVFATDAGTLRGQQGMYPVAPKVEPVEIDASTFAEAWADASN